jgi:phosphatidylserine/phosphatidylglycerophosphate/cardiolipin synthase-like enzyme/regulation of enolase protein 1 (concanavalin A-like superfamily)
MGAPRPVLASGLLLLATATATASAQERLCDASHENCRAPLTQLIDNETVGIDVGVWFIKDARIPTALIRARSRGVPVRMIMDTRANASYSGNAQFIADLVNAGVQMRRRTAGDICHWKLMIFANQGVVEWSGANYSPLAFVPNVAYQDYEDEVIHFSRLLTPSFKKIYDDIWTNTTEYADYANVTRPLTRHYPTVVVDSRLNFPPRDSYQNRLVPLIDKEPARGLIDVDMFRLTMARPIDAIIRAAARGVRVRMYLEPSEYSNPARPGNKVQIDRLVAAAKTYPGTIEIRMRSHAGLNHQKTVWLHAQHVVAFGTSNWSDASDDNQLEANIFTDTVRDAFSDYLFTELNKIFERKFYNEAPDGSVETAAYKTPSLPRPGTAPGVCNDRAATNFGGPAPCTYPPPLPPSTAPTVVLWPATTSTAEVHGTWQVVQDTTAAGGAALANPDFAQGKITPALADPVNAFDMTFSAVANTPYHLWVRMRAQGNSMKNDSIHVQFNDSVTPTGAATMQIGSASSAEIVLQKGDADTSISGWGWADNGWNTAGPHIYFRTTGTHRLRVQQREDGAVIDQIVLSPNLYLTQAPGAGDNDTTKLAQAGGVTPPPPAVLPSGWQTVNIGATSGGSAGESDGTFTVSGGGADIWGTADAFRYVYQTLTGDGTIVARVTSVQNVNAWTKAGVMIRESLDAGSPHASMFVTPGKGLAFQSRATSSGTSLSTAIAGAGPRWVRLVRAGQTVTASVSTDGSTWTAVGQQAIALTQTVFAGLVVSSHVAGQLATATFTSVAVATPLP